ncbi:MAG: response regulator transcription factor [Chloroflexi bacterium]|nr:response regulator transcription factor [Chloroflexota bacterium]
MRMALSTALSAEGITVLAELARSEEVTPHLLTQRPDLFLFSLYTMEQAELDEISSLRKAFPETAVAVLVTGEKKARKAALARGAQLIVDKSVSASLYWPP